MTSTVDVYYDPYDAAIDADPHPVWKRLRDEAPVYYNERHDFWAVSRYDDVLNALLDWETFSSARGIVVEMIDTNPDAVLLDDIPGMLPMMIMMDPPRHDRLRKLVSRAFTPRRVAALEARMREMCAEFLDPHVGGEPFDIMEECAAKVPGMVIGAIMGVPEPDQNELRIWIDAMMRWDPDGTDTFKAESVGKLWKYMQDLVAERRDHPRDDMISDLHAARIADADGGGDTQLTFDEVFGFTQLLIAAGNETTARLLGWTAVLLARHPDQRRILLDDPSVVPNAVEELLRYESPSPIQGRYVTRDVEVAGTTIPAGSRLAILNASGNRDERHFDDPDRFDVRRQIDRHLAFGYGVHFCLGAALARLEGRVVLEEMLARFPDWQVDESSIELVHTSTVRGPHTLQFAP
ncbi:MAG TPA: cytochrome P450 [Acidimicrobiia bacterium]|nr:cytochrome P450 [Acidimicrobiia bacterium]